MIQSECISRDRLHDFSLGFLDDDESSRIEQHIRQCEDCDETLAGLDEATDSLLRHIRQPIVATQYEGDSELKGALHRVCNLDLESQTNTSSFDQPNPFNGNQSLRDYQLAEVIGFGGMGTVYQGVHTRLLMRVAVKVLPERRMRDTAAVSRFQREMQAIGKLDHPSIVRATDAGEVDGTHYLVMELIEGIDLGRLIKTRGPVDVANACEMIRQAADGLQYAHEIGIVHRDIKPSNMMLSERGQIKILDLGLALLGGIDSPVDELTTIGQLMGTVDYMAPEQCGNSHEVTSRADVYALSATLYKLLSGMAPYSGPNYKTALQKLRAVGNEPIERIEKRCDGLPRELADAIHRALAAEPNERFASMQEFADAITPFAAGHDLPGLCSGSKPDCDANRQAEFVDLSRNDSKFVERLQIAAPHQLNGEPVSDGTHAKSAQPIHSSGTSGRGDSGRGFIRWLALAGAAAFFIFAGIVIYLETGKGTLVIESVADDVEVTIRKADKVYETLRLKQGENSTRLAAGNYEIELTGESDSLVVETNSFTLKRGDKIIARISETNERAPKEIAFADVANSSEGSLTPNSDLPVYQGKSIDYWLTEFESPLTRDYAKDAIQALRSHPSSDQYILAAMKKLRRDAEKELSPQRLGDLGYQIAFIAGERHQTEAVKLLFELADKQPAYDPNPEDRANYSAPYFLLYAESGLHYMNDELIQTVVDELKDGSSARRAFAMRLISIERLLSYASESDERVVSLSSQLQKHKQDLAHALLIAGRDENVVVQRSALQRLYQIDDQNPELKQSVWKLIDDDNSQTAVVAFRLAGRLEPNKKAFQGKIDEWVSSDNEKKAFAALNFICDVRVGDDVKPSVTRLLSLLKDDQWGLNTKRLIPNSRSPDYDLKGQASITWKEQSAREYAIGKLGDFGQESAIPQLVKEAKSPWAEIAITANESLAQIKSAQGRSPKTFDSTREPPTETSQKDLPLYNGENLSKWLTDLDAGPMRAVRGIDPGTSGNNAKLESALQAVKILRVEETYRDEIQAAINKWSAIARQERSEDRLCWAVTVIGSLAGEKYSEEAIEAIYAMVSKLPIFRLEGEKQPFESFVEAASSALEQVDKTKLSRRMVSEFAEGTAVTRAFTLALLHSRNAEFPSDLCFHPKGFLDYFDANREPVIKALLAASRDENKTVARHSTGIITVIALHDAQVINRLVELLDEEDQQLALKAAKELANVEPENEKLQEKLSQWVISKSAPTVFAALSLLEPSNRTPNKSRIKNLMELLKEKEWGLDVESAIEVPSELFRDIATDINGIGVDEAGTVRRTAREHAIILLGQFGVEAEEALSILEKESNSEISNIAKAAKEAISSVGANSNPKNQGGFF